MAETRVSSDGREVFLGFDRCFVIVGERVHPTGRELLATAIAAGDYPGVAGELAPEGDAGGRLEGRRRARGA